MSARRWVAIVGAALAATGVFMYVNLLGSAFFPAPLLAVLALVAALASARLVLRSRPGEGAVRGAVRGALVAGSLGLLLGFVGPLLLAPDNGLGPLLGIFTTGPLGAAGGAILGAWRGARGAGTTT